MDLFRVSLYYACDNLVEIYRNVIICVIVQLNVGFSRVFLIFQQLPTVVDIYTNKTGIFTYSPLFLLQACEDLQPED